MDKQELESILSRIRESTIFFIKADALVFAGIVTAVGAFKLDILQILKLGGDFSWVLNSVIGLLIASLLLECVVTIMPRHNSEKSNLSLSRLARVLYFLLVFGHTVGATFALGFSVGYMESFASRI